MVFEITEADIKALEDKDLRTLIGLLCEADYANESLSTNGITWSGHQDAKDGGRDVVVNTPKKPKSSYVPKKNSIFQVKKPAMPPSKINGEMRFKGKLRPEITEQIKKKGAYIIVSSGDQTTETGYEDRIKAMKAAVANEDPNGQLTCDFYDRGRIASWVRLYPFLAVWVKNKVSKGSFGWKPYENWSKTPAGIDEEYLIDDGLAIRDPKNNKHIGLEAIEKLRQIVGKERASIRLVGLSGLGKTRFAQALFDTRIGDAKFSIKKIYYTDIGDNASPDPMSLASQLIEAKEQGLIIVDNCSPDLHRRLTEVVSQDESKISLLTIEYDVRDDLPENTQVWQLEPAGDEIIRKLIQSRHPHISQVDARRISDFAGGNARVAIAIASTVAVGENLANLRDNALFERIFHQRNEVDKNLLHSAEVLSIVYSFNGEDVSEESELGILGSLIGLSADELHNAVFELKQRGLIQARSKWRALLPQAIANRLANNLLKRLPKDKIETLMINCGSERLLKSFSKRLGFLHDNESATEIVEKWLLPNGMIGQSIFELTEFKQDMLTSVAPVAPSATLRLLLQASNDTTNPQFLYPDNPSKPYVIRLLRLLAWQTSLFKDCVDTLIKFIKHENRDENKETALKTLQSLFSLYLSGTHAPIEVRLQTVEKLLRSGDALDAEIALKLIDALLEASHFSSSNEFSFGARTRDYGFHPTKLDEIQLWYRRCFELVLLWGSSSHSHAAEIRNTFAKKIRGIWIRYGLYQELDSLIRQFAKIGRWSEARLELKRLIKFDAGRMPLQAKEMLALLDTLLEPISLRDKADSIFYHGLDMLAKGESEFDQATEESFKRNEDAARDLGIEVVANSECLTSMLPDLVSKQGPRIFSFGRGLAMGAKDIESVWQQLLDAYKSAPSGTRNMQVLRGYLNGCAAHDRKTFNDLMASIYHDENLRGEAIYFECSTEFDDDAMVRLKNAMANKAYPTHAFQALQYGRYLDDTSDSNFVGLFDLLLEREDSEWVAIDLLGMKIELNRQKNVTSVPIDRAGVRLLSKPSSYSARRPAGMGDYYLTSILRSSANSASSEDAESISKAFSDAMKKQDFYGYDFGDYLNLLAEKFPTEFMNEIVGKMSPEDYRFDTFFSDDDFSGKGNPINNVPDNIILEWANSDGRILSLAAYSDLYSKPEGEGLKWRPIAMALLNKSTDKEKVFNALSLRLEPNSWMGSRADMLEARIPLLVELSENTDRSIARMAQSRLIEFNEKITTIRHQEEQELLDRDQSFE